MFCFILEDLRDDLRGKFKILEARSSPKMVLQRGRVLEDPAAEGARLVRGCGVPAKHVPVERTILTCDVILNIMARKHFHLFISRRINGGFEIARLVCEQKKVC